MTDPINAINVLTELGKRISPDSTVFGQRVHDMGKPELLGVIVFLTDEVNAARADARREPRLKAEHFGFMGDDC